MDFLTSQTDNGIGKLRIRQIRLGNMTHEVRYLS